MNGYNDKQTGKWYEEATGIPRMDVEPPNLPDSALLDLLHLVLCAGECGFGGDVDVMGRGKSSTGCPEGFVLRRSVELCWKGKRIFSIGA